MSRRDLIRAAAATGVAAWTAPIIVDSVSSAALGTTGTGPCPQCTISGIAKWNKDTTCAGGDTTLACVSSDGNADCDAVVASCLGITHGAAFSAYGTCPSPVGVTQHCGLDGSATGATITISGTCRIVSIFRKQGSGCVTEYCQREPTTSCPTTFEFTGDFSHFIVAWCCL